MVQKTTIAEIDIERLWGWVGIISPVLVAIRPPEVFEDMGFPPAFVRQHVEDLLSVQGHGSPGHKIVRGVSDASFLRSVAEVIGADTSEGDSKLCSTNRILAWKEACIRKLDEIMRGLDRHEQSGAVEGRRRGSAAVI